MSKTKRYWHDVVGYNGRMTNLQAALGVAQLERWDMIINRKEEIRALYRELLASTGLREPVPCNKAESVCWMYTVSIRGESSIREGLMDALKRHNVDVRQVFFPIPAMPPYYETSGREIYPVAYALSESGFSLPTFVDLTDDDIVYITNKLRNWFRK